MSVSKALIVALATLMVVAASGGIARATDVIIHHLVTLYTGPGQKFQVVSNLGAGEKIQVLWCNGANWCRVQSNLFEGWAPLSQLLPGKLQGDGIVLDDDSSSDNPDLAAILAASPDGSSGDNLLGGGSGSGGGLPSSSDSSSGPSSGQGMGLSVSTGGNSVLSLKVR